MEKEITQITKITPKFSWTIQDLYDLWHYRELVYIFVWRDIKVRYKQTALGVLWVIFQPIISTIIFTIFFGKLTRISAVSLPYPLFVLSGLIFWTFFSTSLSQASESLIQNESIIRKVYFPKILLPISSVFASLIDVGINIFLLIIAAYIFGFLPSVWTIFLFPAAIILISLTSVGMGLFLSSINIRFRDVRYILPFFIQLTLFLTPVVYPLTIVSQRNKYIMAINPLTTAIELVRQSFSVSPQIDAGMIGISCISVLFFLLTGIWVFYRTERFFADIV